MQILCDKNYVHINFLPEGYKLSKDFTMANGGSKTVATFSTMRLVSILSTAEKIKPQQP